jgi:hypothetical protein
MLAFMCEWFLPVGEIPLRLSLRLIFLKKDTRKDRGVLGGTLVHCSNTPRFVELEIVPQTLQCRGNLGCSSSSSRKICGTIKEKQEKEEEKKQEKEKERKRREERKGK